MRELRPSGNSPPTNARERAPTMPKPTYVTHQRITLKDHPDFNERWLQDLITKTPAVLGLPGEPEVIDRERQQERAGRLDLLLHDHEEDRRFELELMLGSLDESHIIRAIEYWDIERRRYPSYEHIAVVVAEDVTGRFLNILSLLAGTIPLIVLQCNALIVDDKLVLDFVKVLDQTSLRRDDEAEVRAPTVSRDYWLQRAGEPLVTLCDKVLALLNEAGKRKFELNYNRQYIGIKDGTRNTMFVFFGLRRRLVNINAVVPEVDSWVTKLLAAGLDAWQSKDGARAGVTIGPDDLKRAEPHLRDLFASAVAEYEA
jgi:hypothetical protein